jgi:hypothetical protein
MSIGIKSIFVKPREAFQIAGQESFGSSWEPSFIDDPDSPFHQTALRNLRAALESGKVVASYHNFDTEHLLQPYQAAGEFFHINLAKDCIHLADGAPQQCKINAEELADFIRSHATGGPRLTAGAVTHCYGWLVEVMQTGERVPPKAALFEQAKSKFPGLSWTGFEGARTRAIEATGRHELRAPGRPKASEI